MTAYIDYTRLLIEVGLCRLGVQVRDERGAMSTEAKPIYLIQPIYIKFILGLEIFCTNL